jgi:hypothetical protein
VTAKIFACVTAVIGAAVLTLAVMIALVQSTILAVRILGVGQADFPPHSGGLQVPARPPACPAGRAGGEPTPVPEDAGQTDPPKN